MISPTRTFAAAPGVAGAGFLRGDAGRSAEDRESTLDHARDAAMTPLARVALPEDAAGRIRFLLGRNAGFMTGQALRVNGGGSMP